MVSDSDAMLNSTCPALNVSGNCTLTAALEFPPYIRTAATLAIALLLTLGTVGNLLVPLVVCKTKDLRNSTNLFLINLSVSDLLVLLVCMPTALVELHSQPEVWILGEGMCRLIPFLELAVAHVSILTILAISFERYYAICKPLKAGYTCTKMRALAIIATIWVVALLVTSPMLAVSEYGSVEYYDGSNVLSCGVSYGVLWRKVYILATIALLFVLPFFILVIVYSCIAQHLMIHGRALSCSSSEQAQIRARRQVVMMLVAVVLSFFLCLLPYRVFIVWIIAAPEPVQAHISLEVFYNLLYVCRLMLYLNSAINPILYNAISSKFRDAFCRLLGCRRHRLLRQSTTNTQTSTSLTFQSSLKSRSSINNGAFNSVVSVGGTPPTAKSV
ncbi:growth hormone secretagogue receptor type 1-like isoform X1 [Ornithodoros turicata]|uniref:growth hormone secretagogue receptor type 1-like isoform X1 n=1 Tax=Ornithodoros turicata TaxID=34597 RepID=UPI00313A1C02